MGRREQGQAVRRDDRPEIVVAAMNEVLNQLRQRWSYLLDSQVDMPFPEKSGRLAELELCMKIVEAAINNGADDEE